MAADCGTRQSTLRALLPAFALCLLLAGPSDQANFLSHTTESHSQCTTWQVCPDSPHDLEWLGDFNLTQYKRNPHVEHFRKHRRALDQPEIQTEGPWGDPEWKVETIYEYPTLLPSLNIQNAVSNLGDTRRLERVLFKFLTGQPVKIVALGGSVTVGHGPENKQTAWLYRVFDWLNATFPHAEHQFINKGVPAVTSGYIAPCVLSLVPPDTDLILLEFTFNDAERTGSNNMEEPTRMGLERLLRKLLQIEGKPAILNVHYHPFNVYQHYWDSGQERMELLLKYYTVPSLSMRSAMHRKLSDEPWLVSKLWPYTDVHPTCIGYKYLADVVIGFLQDMSASVLHTYHSLQHLPHADVLLDQSPAPLFEGNSADQLENCILDDDFRDLSIDNKGWEWLDEGKKPGQHKWGYVSYNPGEEIVLRVPISDFLPVLPEDRLLLVGLGVLMSYEHSGWMDVDCNNGCSCDHREVNSHNPTRYSLTYWKGLKVSVDEGSETCELVIVNADKTTSGEHKVKLTSLLVSLELNTFIESWTYE